jgi:hypothetical protein
MNEKNSPDAGPPTVPSPVLPMVSFVLSVFGCLGWVVVISLLSPYPKEQGWYKLLPFIGNFLVLVVLGGITLLLSLSGLVLAFRARKKSGGAIVVVSIALSMLSLGIALCIATWRLCVVMGVFPEWVP